MRIRRSTLKRIIAESQRRLIESQDWDMEILEHLFFDQGVDLTDDAGIAEVIANEHWDYPDSIPTYNKLLATPLDVRAALQKQLE